MKKLAVLASGEGTIFQSIVDHIKLGILVGVEPAVLICNRPEAGVLKRAERAGVHAVLIPHKRPDGSRRDREEFEAEVVGILKSMGVDIVFLAGWDKVLGPTFVDEFKLRAMNVHPSLLPAFAGLYGLEVHKNVLSRGCKVSGTTVHYIDYGIDTGPIILQAAIRVRSDDTPESLSERVRMVERLVVPMAIQLHVDGRLEVKDNVVRTDLSGHWLDMWRERQSRYLSQWGLEDEDLFLSL
jgi:phosphoribosylglycinamide formyltransferase-1